MDSINQKQSDTHFWNSKIGLFLLSALFLTFIPFVYTNIQDTITKSKFESKQRTKLVSEINHRLEVIELLANNNIRPYQIKNIRLATYGIKQSLEPEYYSFSPIFAEFETVTLQSLIYQFDNISYSINEKKANKLLIESIQKVKPYIDKLVLNPDYRKKVTLNENKWTFEYAFMDLMKVKVEENILKNVRAWQGNLD